MRTLLLVVAAAHGATMLILFRIKHQQREEDLAEEITEQVEERMHGEPSVRRAREHTGHRPEPANTTVEVRTPNDPGVLTVLFRNGTGPR